MGVCKHNFKYEKTICGYVNYGRTTVGGCHHLYICFDCSKYRWKIEPYKRRVIRNDKYLPRQLTLW